MSANGHPGLRAKAAKRERDICSRSKALGIIAATALMLLGRTGIAEAQTAVKAFAPTTAPGNASTADNSQQPVAETQPNAAEDSKASAAGSSDAESLKQLIGVNSTGLKHVDLPKMPVMSLSGFVQPHGGPARALLQIADLNRTFLVEKGTKIPISVPGRISPIGRSELVGLSQTAAPAVQSNDATSESQIILRVVEVSDEGVTVEAGLIDQTIVVR